MGQLTALASLFGGPALATLLLIISARLLTSFVSASRAASAVPLIGAEYGSVAKRRKAYLRHAGALYKKGYEQFRDKVYRITTADGKARITMVSSCCCQSSDRNCPLLLRRALRHPAAHGRGDSELSRRRYQRPHCV